jgi:hypothetical protein
MAAMIDPEIDPIARAPNEGCRRSGGLELLGGTMVVRWWPKRAPPTREEAGHEDRSFIRHTSMPMDSAAISCPDGLNARP